MYTATIPLVINQFVPIGNSGCIQATYGPPTTNPPPSHKGLQNTHVSSTAARAREDSKSLPFAAGPPGV